MYRTALLEFRGGSHGRKALKINRKFVGKCFIIHASRLIDFSCYFFFPIRYLIILQYFYEKSVAQMKFLKRNNLKMYYLFKKRRTKIL